jgi:hypothetical protein
VVGEVANLVFLISKENGCSYNKAAQIVAQMIMDKFKEIQFASLELKEYCKNHQATSSQMVSIDHYILGCNNFVCLAHACYSPKSSLPNSANIVNGDSTNTKIVFTISQPTIQLLRILDQPTHMTIQIIIKIWEHLQEHGMHKSQFFQYLENLN